MVVKLHVVIRIPDETPREFDLSFDKAKIVMGREDSCDVVLPISTVSRRHASLFQEGEDWFLEDNHSTHGTICNGQSLGSGGKRLVRDGDIIEIVHAQIFLHLVDQAMEPVTEEQTSIVAKKMVGDALRGLESGADLDVPYLLFLNGPLEGKKIPIGSDINEISLGRGAECTVQLPDANVSRKHCVIRRNLNEITIEDLQSKNGVVVNGKKTVGRERLVDAADIFLGAIHLTYIDRTQSMIGRLSEIPIFAENNPPVQSTEIPLPAPEKVIQTPPVATQILEKPSVNNKFGSADYFLIFLAALIVIGLVVGILLLVF